MVHQKVQCVSIKLLELQMFLSLIRCDIFCVSEHCKSEETKSINIDEYILRSCIIGAISETDEKKLTFATISNLVKIVSMKNFSEDRQFEIVEVKIHNKFTIILSL